MKRWHFPRCAPWAQRVIDQCVDFPNGSHDDAFDANSLMARAIADAHPAIIKSSEERAERDYGRRIGRNTSGMGWKTS